jgi:hypothetical protein
MIVLAFMRNRKPMTSGLKVFSTGGADPVIIFTMTVMGIAMRSPKASKAVKGAPLVNLLNRAEKTGMFILRNVNTAVHGITVRNLRRIAELPEIADQFG